MCTVDEIYFGVPRKYSVLTCPGSYLWSSTDCGENDEGVFVTEATTGIWSEGTAMESVLYPVVLPSIALIRLRRTMDTYIQRVALNIKESGDPWDLLRISIPVVTKKDSGILRRGVSCQHLGKRVGVSDGFEKEVDDQRFFLRLENGMDGFYALVTMVHPFEKIQENDALYRIPKLVQSKEKISC